jgi:hypothetical protein
MKKLDFDCGEIATKETIVYTSANEYSIEKFKYHLLEAFESIDCTILDIERVILFDELKIEKAKKEGIY